jgi:hypothetical protein
MIAPPPTPPAIKTIVHVKSSPVCTEFRQLVLPLALIQQKNGGLMQYIRKQTQEYRKFSLSMFHNPDLLHASNIDAAATTILQNLAPLNKLLAESWKRSPKGTNRKIDAIRQRVQNIADLQRAIANQEVQFGGAIVDTNGMDVMAAASSGFGARVAVPSPPPNAVQLAVNASPPPPPQDVGSVPPEFGAFSGAGPNLLPEADPRVPSTVPGGFSAKDLPLYRFAALEDALVQESVSLTPVAMALAHDCDGVKP